MSCSFAEVLLSGGFSLRQLKPLVSLQENYFHDACFASELEGGVLPTDR